MFQGLEDVISMIQGCFHRKWIDMLRFLDLLFLKLYLFEGDELCSLLI